jgi:hypothetical protein
MNARDSGLTKARRVLHPTPHLRPSEAPAARILCQIWQQDFPLGAGTPDCGKS